jgi:Protein of unknown function (DUF4012)
MTPMSSSPTARRRGRVALLVAGLVVAATLLVAVPLGWTWWQARSTQDSLEETVGALRDGDHEAAVAHVEQARAHADRLAASQQGLLGLLWDRLPVLGASADDTDRLVEALDLATSVAETGVAVQPLVSGDDATLVRDGRVDLDILDEVVAAFRRVDRQLADARELLTDVRGDSPLLGGMITELREEGLHGIDPVLAGLDTARPVVDVLPDVLGADGPRKYLIAILNPAELLYSGGTPLTFAPMTVDRGRIELGTPQDTATHGVAFRPRYWRKVPHNPFHRGPLRIGTASFAPDWSVSGEEVLNAWRSLRGRQMAGLLAVDVMALRDLVALTGPLDVPYYGAVSAETFVPTLISSYDAIPDYRVRHQINQALVPVFRDRLFATGRFVDKFAAMHTAAKGRHLAVYFRDDATQQAFRGLGLTGELSDTDHDYLGVFTQNAVPSKTDYWQARSVQSRVALRPDGSAHVALDVAVHNDSPPYAGKGPDPQQGYSTRWATLSVASFLARGADVRTVRVDGQPVDFHVGDFFGRPFVRHTVTFPPQTQHTVRLEYDVPAAAVRDGDRLTYHLDIDPQGTVRPGAIGVEVTWPQGWTPNDVPDGWFTDGRRAAWGGPALLSSYAFEVTGRRH